MSDPKSLAGRIDHIRAGLHDVVSELDRSTVGRRFNGKEQGQAAQLLMGAITRCRKAAAKLREDRD